MMNKKGGLVLRDVMFMLIIFSSLFALATLFVIDMASEYDNTNLQNEYNTIGAGALGNRIFGNVSASVEVMREKTESSTESEDSLLGSFTSITGVIQGAAAILKAVILAPVYISDAIQVMMNAINIPKSISYLVGNMIMLLIYSVIIFVIISSLLKGGKV